MKIIHQIKRKKTNKNKHENNKQTFLHQIKNKITPNIEKLKTFIPNIYRNKQTNLL